MIDNILYLLLCKQSHVNNSQQNISLFYIDLLALT